jgi:hypothetical protein
MENRDCCQAAIPGEKERRIDAAGEPDLSPNSGATPADRWVAGLRRIERQPIERY